MAKLVLKRDEEVWIRQKWAKIRQSQVVADEANGKWQKINAEINRYLDESGVVDIVQRARIKGESIPLKDALETGKWHSANAQRHIDDVMLFLKLKELEIF